MNFGVGLDVLEMWKGVLLLSMETCALFIISVVVRVINYGEGGYKMGKSRV